MRNYVINYLATKGTALEARLRLQQDELDGLREYQREREERDREEQSDGSDQESGDELELLPPSPGADEARERLERATARMRRARPHAAALEKAMSSLIDIANLELARPNRSDTTATSDGQQASEG